MDLTQETFQNMWFPAQINFNHDVLELSRMSREDVDFYKFLFTFLGMAECLVNLNIDEVLLHFDGHDLRHYYGCQVTMENIHAKTYANILKMFFNNNDGEMYKYAEAIVKDEALVKKIGWLRNRVIAANKKSEKVLLFLLIEGIFFTSSFYCIGMLRLRGIMKGVCMANDYISRDELLHTRAAALMYNTLVSDREKPDVAWIHDLFREAVEVEHEFILAKGEGIKLVNVDDIKMFLQATADRILGSINVPILYGTPPPPACPLTYMGSLKNVNFFERESTDYTASVTDDL